MKNSFYSLACLLLIHFAGNAQMKIGDNPTNINSASLLELETTNKGLVLPRISIPHADSPQPLPPGLLEGTMVYNTNPAIVKGKGVGLYSWSGTGWESVAFKDKYVWVLAGNAGTNPDSNFLGTTDNVGLSIRTNNIQRMLVDSFGGVAIGLPTFNPNPNNRELFLVDYGNTNSNTVASFKGSIDSYLQINVQNMDTGLNASSDFVATANDGTDSTFYIDMGINSSNYNPGIENWGNAHDAYLYSNSRHLLLGTQALGSDLIFLLGGGRIRENSVMRINGPSGNIVIGKGDNTDTPEGNTIRGPNSSDSTIAGGNLTLRGGRGTGSAPGGSLNLFGGISAAGALGAVNISGAVNIIATPLNIAGIQATSSVTSDSVLTIYDGALKKAAYSDVFTFTKNLITVSLPEIGNNEGASVDITVPNTPYVAGGPNPVVTINPEVDLPDGLVIAWMRVFAPDNVRIHFRNVTNSTILSQQIPFDVSVLR